MTDRPSSTDEPSAGPLPAAVTGVDVKERPAWQMNGFLAVLAAGILLLLAFILLGGFSSWAGQVLLVLAALAMPVLFGALAIIQPGETRVVQFFGQYVGTIRRSGLVLALPFTTRRPVSVRVHNFETERLKVNDSDGNPVELAAIVVWQVADTAKATFAVESYDTFIAVQADAALRHVARSYPYDAPDGVESLRGSTDVISIELAREVAARVVVGGLEIFEVRISHLAYAPEIAQAMLQRQQASAVVAARSRIVEGAVGMVQMALDALSNQGVVELNQERRAAMVSNLLVVLCGDSRATPVVNTGATPNG